MLVGYVSPAGVLSAASIAKGIVVGRPALYADCAVAVGGLDDIVAGDGVLHASQKRERGGAAHGEELCIFFVLRSPRQTESESE